MPGGGSGASRARASRKRRIRLRGRRRTCTWTGLTWHKPLSQLRSEEREAIYLQVVQGYTAAEAAELMERPRGTVLSLIHRGKARLRMLLRDQARQEDR